MHFLDQKTTTPQRCRGSRANGDDLAASGDPSCKMNRRTHCSNLDHRRQRRLMERLKVLQIKRAVITPKIPKATANASCLSSPLLGMLTTPGIAGADHDQENGEPSGSCHRFFLQGFDHSLLGSILNQFRRLKVASRITSSDSLCSGRGQPSTSGLTKRLPKIWF